MTHDVVEPGAFREAMARFASGVTVVTTRDAQGAPADYPAAQAYAACLIAHRCLEEADRPCDEALWQAACALDCTTFFGRFKIDPKTGLQVGHEMVWVQWQRGRKVVVWPPRLAEAAAIYPRS